MPPIHDCPIDGCQQPVPQHHLMCTHHWAMVPADLSREVYHRYARGKGAGSPAHLTACLNAVDSVNALLNANQ